MYNKKYLRAMAPPPGPPPPLVEYLTVGQPIKLNGRLCRVSVITDKYLKVNYFSRSVGFPVAAISPDNNNIVIDGSGSGGVNNCFVIDSWFSMNEYQNKCFGGYLYD